MKFGSPNQFDNVPLIPDNGIITKSYLRNIEASIKQRTPIAGDNVTIKVTDGGYNISVTGGSSKISNLKVITLTVCSNGMPATIQVYGP
jgi:hypothetical protein